MQFLLNDFSDHDLQFVINSLCILRVHFSTVFFQNSFLTKETMIMIQSIDTNNIFPE